MDGRSAGYDYDVAVVSDLRYPGGNSASIVEEINAQSLAGYSTAVVHLPAAHMKRRRSFHHRIIHCLSTGMAKLESPTRPLRVRALILRQPRIFADPLQVVPRIEADAKVLVINHPPFDGRFPVDSPYYRPADVRARAEAAFGELTWAPIGPRVRDSLHETGADLDLAPDDWHNIINVDEWWADRSGFVRELPVIGRHSRGHVAKWPADSEELLAAYPERSDVAVKILGGADPAIETLGRKPANWTVYPFGSVRPADFLREIDFFVYFHHADWVEAFGRNTIEALASGVPAILPDHFEPLFGDAAIYCEPRDVVGLVEGLYGDRAAYEARVESGRAFVSDRFGADVHIRRLRALIGPPSGAARRTVPPPRRPRALLVAAGGEESVARLLELARRLPSRVEPVFVVIGAAIGPVVAAGYMSDHLALAPGSEERDRRWLAKRLREIDGRERPDAVVVDGPAVTDGMRKGIAECSAPAFWFTSAAADDLPASRGDLFASVVPIGDDGVETLAELVMRAVGRPRAMLADSIGGATA